MSIECHPKSHIAIKDNDPEIKHFFDRILVQFNEELNHINNNLYNHYPFESRKKIFAQNEQSWVGILNNSIVKAHGGKCATLQEYGVYNDNDKFVGRADFLVSYKTNSNRTVYFLFEAKQCEENRKQIRNSSEKWFEKIREQGMGYYKANESYFNGKLVFIVPIVFGWIRNKELMDEVKKVMNEEKSMNTDFCSLYCDGEIDGVWVYGNVKNVNV